jgi:gamma-glutamylcyclotransferase (GGCT)/AIG2-like uncharacterized protein YtfP
LTPTRLFVYGTLLEGQPAGGLLAGMPRQAARLRGRLWVLPAGYPVLVDAADGIPIAGELVTLPHEGVLRVVDVYEGGPGSIYRREAVEVEVEGQRLAAWVYRAPEAEVRRAGARRARVDDWRRIAPRGD